MSRMWRMAKRKLKTMSRLRDLYGKDYEDWHNSQDDLLIYMRNKEKKKEIKTLKKIKNKHENLRNILIKSGSKEYGDLILDEICNLFEYPPTWIYYKEGE